MSGVLQSSAERLSAWLTDHALPLWWRAGADRTVGGFHEGLEHDGRPAAAARRTRVQARQIYVYATASELSWDGESRQAMEHGLDFLLTRYTRPDGLLRTLVSPEGAPADETAMLYDQAFGLFALAAARKAAPDRADLEPAALAILAALEAGRRHAAGGFVEEGKARYQANAHMHLFEASLAWREVSDAPVWDALADEIAVLALERFIDPAGGFLREFFDAQWRPAAGDDGRLIEPGHQFEWAWLMERWSRLRGNADARRAAERLYAAGLAGVDRVRGVAIDGLWDDLSVRDAGARLWPQTERLKATVALAPDNDAEVQAAVDGLALYFDVPIRGLWRDKLRPDGSFVEEFAPASSFYHIACAIHVLRAAAA